MSTTQTVNLKSRTILVVTDQPLSAMRMRAGLRALPNCNVSFAFDKTDAYQLASQEQPDLLIIDYHNHSLALAKTFRRVYPDIVMIILSTQYRHKARRSADNWFVHRILENPVSMAELYQIALAALAEAP